jgi:hypothetical protein
VIVAVTLSTLARAIADPLRVAAELLLLTVLVGAG